MHKGDSFIGHATPPVWDARMIPSSQVTSGMPPALPTSLAAPSAQIVAVQPPAVNLSEEVANKAAEITVLRSRLKQLEAENLKIKNEVVVAKDKGSQSETARQMRGDVERLQNELRYVKQDLISSEEERKRLKTSSDEMVAELKATKSKQIAAQIANVPTPSPLAASTVSSPSKHQNVPSGHQVAMSSSMQPPSGHQVATSSSMQPPTVVAAASAGLPVQVKAGTTPSHSSSATFARTPATSSHPSRPTSTPPALLQSSRPACGKSMGQHWRQDILMRELSAWEAMSKGRSHKQARPEPSPWFALHDAVTKLANAPKPSEQSGPLLKVRNANDDIAIMIVKQLESARSGKLWEAVQAGARFVQVLSGLAPQMISLMKVNAAAVGETSPGSALCDELTNALHDVVLGSPNDDTDEKTDDAVCHECVSQVVETMVEIASKLRAHELIVFSNAFRRPSLCALIGQTPERSSLHRPCMNLLQVLLSSSELYALAHGTDSRENPLLAVANLLVVPAIESGDRNETMQPISELQQCRIAALEVFCRCLASAPRLDIVLQLRGAPTSDGGMVDTVLQRIVFLCHHDLLCLGLHGVAGGPWHEQSMKDAGKARQRSVELSLMILSSFVWHAAPWNPDAQTSNPAAACADACTLLGRMRPLIGSIVDMVVRRAADSDYYTRLLGRTSSLRILLAHVDGDNHCVANEASSVVLGGDRAGSAMVPMIVE